MSDVFQKNGAWVINQYTDTESYMLVLKCLGYFLALLVN